VVPRDGGAGVWRRIPVLVLAKDGTLWKTVDSAMDPYGVSRSPILNVAIVTFCGYLRLAHLLYAKTRISNVFVCVSSESLRIREVLKRRLG
jgi:hypothetical protein